jgi:outer membrane protein OmpA-like peptidoglycan-associated protein
MTIRQLQRITPPQPESKNWLIEHLKGNIISSLSILVMMFGLCTIYAYHFHIEYFPLIGIDSFTSIIFATTYVGILLLLGFGAVLFAPNIFIGFVWQAANKKNNRPKPQRQLHLLALLGTSLLSFTFWTVLFFIYGQFYTPVVNIPYAAFWICILSLFLGRLIWLRKKGLAKPAREWRATLEDATNFSWPYIVTLPLQLFPISMLLQIIRDNSYLTSIKPDYISVGLSVFNSSILLLLCAGCFIITWFGKRASKLEKGSALVAMLFFPLVGSFFLGNVSFFPATIARLTKVGNFYANEITLSGAGCAALAKKGVLSCPAEGDEPFKLCGAWVMSRFGSETYIKVNFGQKGDQPGQAANKGAKNAPQKTSTTANDIKLENIYLPSATILGMKVDTSVTASNITKIDDYLKQHVSICPAEKAELQTAPYSFKATELFEHAQSMLNSEGQKKLDAFIRVMADNKKPVETINIAGYTDQTGNAHYNMTLSLMRALAVEDYLRQNLAADIAPKQFHSQGYGNTRPKKTRTDCPGHWPQAKQLACFAENRRVDIEVILR